MTKAILAAVLGVATTVVAGEPQIEMYQTCEGEQFRQLDTFIPFSKHRAVSVPVLNLDAAKPSHVWKGLGVSFSEAGCKILSELSAEDREIGGLGIFIAKKTMDSLSYSYENGENILTMIKKF